MEQNTTELSLDTEVGRETARLRMRELRESAGLSQTVCAEALGVARNTYNDIENGNLTFRRRDLVTLAALYGMPIGEAFPGFS